MRAVLHRPRRLYRLLGAGAGALTLVGSAVFTASPPAVAAPDPGTVPAAQVRADEWWLSSLHITEAWAASHKGAGVKVGVLDRGVPGSLRDLSDAVVGGKDFSGKGSADGQKPVDGGFNDSDHGAAMAGYIAGRGHGSGHRLGMMGVAPAASIVSASVARSGSTLTSEPALRWLVDQGVQVVNVSLGDEAISASDIAYAQAHDVIVVAASGNDGQHALQQPASLPGVVAVGGVVRNLGSDPISNFASTPGFPAGDTSAAPSQVSGGLAVVGPSADKSAPSNDPGAGMVALTTGGTQYKRATGTSNSAAIVTGIVALIRAAHPQMKAADVVSQLVQTARHYNPKGTDYTPAQGFGVPNAFRAVTATLPSVCENPLGSQTPPLSSGLWVSVFKNTKYQPTCTGSTASPSSDGSRSSSDAALPPTSSDSGSSGVPVWVWPVVAVVVIAVIVGVVVTRRGRRSA